MSTSAAHAHPGSGHAHGHGHDHGHPAPGFWSHYVFSTDHKTIGIQYGLTALVFLFLGFCLMLVMRWQLAYPGQPIPVIGGWLPKSIADAGILLPEGYNAFGAMHGTIMVFLAIVPLGVGAFGNYILPLMIGAQDMAFPRLNMASYWSFLPGCVVMFASFFLPGGPAQSGWTSYPPLSNIATSGQTWWLLGMVFLITSSLLGSVNFIVTTIHMRAPGLTMFRLPFFVWAQLVTSFLLLLAFPPLEAAAVLQLMDRVAGTSFFMPEGLIISTKLLTESAGVFQGYSGGGSPLLWQHLFWFLAHPEVYVLILPAMGIVSEVIASNTRKPLWGYKSLVFSVIFLGFMSFVVWAHHMYMTGMGQAISIFFQATTMIISGPSVVILTALLISLWGASIRYTVPMLFATAFLPMFAIGGLTGLPLGLTASDIHLHDTYYVIGHFHYVVAPGTIFAVFAGIYHWYPKVTGRMMNQFLGKAHFWLSFLFINGVFMPMFWSGMAGALRRQYDPLMQLHAETVQGLGVMTSWSAWLLGLTQLLFILNFFWSLKAGAPAGENPWHATTLEWATEYTPPRHGNFAAVPTVHRGPYEYSVPGHAADFVPQHEHA